MNKKDWTLLTIAAAEGKNITPVQLQKCLFLLGQNFGKRLGGDFYNFIPYDYGPFSSDIYSDVTKLQQEGLIRIEHIPGIRWVEYSATLTGMAQSEEFQKNAPQDIVKKLKEIVQWARSLSFEKLISEIYKEYPKYKVRSVFKN